MTALAPATMKESDAATSLLINPDYLILRAPFFWRHRHCRFVHVDFFIGKSKRGILTLLLQDQVEGLQIQHQGKWVTVEPLPNSFIVNDGDHLEIFSNGRYKSVLHRVVVNSSKSRISVASLHSLPFDAVVRPSPKLVDEANPTRYRDTDFANFLEYIASCDHQTKSKSFLESRKLTD
ncbi:hypothetical protein ACLB2K_072662 [Fragaria x ananassa]